MFETQVSLPEIGLVAGTRAALGFGLGLLLADCWSPEQRRAIGWTLFAVGAVTTVPLFLDVIGHRVDAGNGRTTEAAVPIAE